MGPLKEKIIKQVGHIKGLEAGRKVPGQTDQKTSNKLMTGKEAGEEGNGGKG